MDRRRRPEWVPDEFSPYCANCGAQFSLTVRRVRRFPCAPEEWTFAISHTRVSLVDRLISTTVASVATSSARHAPPNRGRSPTLATKPRSGA
jgi:hypothetical protein